MGAAAAAAAAVPEFTVSPDDYRLLEEVGFGANAVVYRAVFLPANRTIAVKCLDLDRVNSNLVSSLSRARARPTLSPVISAISRCKLRLDPFELFVLLVSYDYSIRSLSVGFGNNALYTVLLLVRHTP